MNTSFNNFHVLLSTFLMLILGACAPSQQAVQTAIAQTQLAAATLTPSPTLTSTLTQTPVPTNTPTLTPSPTADLRIIDTDPQKLLLSQKDLPKEGLYFLPAGWMSINTNEEVISNRGVEEGRKYVIDTQRVTGWWVNYARGTRAVKMPDEIIVGVFMFKTAEGARLANRKFNSVETSKNEKWKYIDENCDIGEDCIIEALYVIDSGGQKNTYYSIGFTYKNLMGTIDGYAINEEDVPPDLIQSLAEKLFEKMKTAPLVEPGEAVFP